jgi:hypothetical protein
MPSKAHVSSVDALDAFRASLIVYLEKANRILDDIRQEVVNTRTWLHVDRQRHWKSETRKRTADLVQAQQELLTARLSGQDGAIQDRRIMVQKAQAALDEAQSASVRVKTWLRRYESVVEPELRGTYSLHQVLGHDMKKAVALLERAADILEEYADLVPTAAPKGTAGAAPNQEPLEDPVEKPPAETSSETT